MTTKTITEIPEVDIIGSGDEDRFAETYELSLLDEQRIEIEHVLREDWDGLRDPCPECNGTEFDHMRYEGGHYGQEKNTVIQRDDYWDQKGSLYTACRSCNEVLYKNPAYDVLEAVVADTLSEITKEGSD